MRYDVIIIGGSYAGLSAAMSLGRALRKVLVIDEAKPCNQQTPHSHNFLTQDGSTPAHIATLGKEQVLKYPTITFHHGKAVAAKGKNGNFEVKTAAAEVFYTTKIIFATGLKDIIPAIPGFEDCWGISVIHCPYCHGYEYKEQETGILLNGDPAFELARMIRNLTSRLTIFTNGNALISETHQAQLTAMGVRIEEREISEFVHKNGYISSIVFKDGKHSLLDALYARPPFEQHCQIPKEIGCKFTDGGHIQIDDVQRTSIPGIFAAGDNATGFRAVAIAIAAGNKAGAVINHELVAEKIW